MTHQSKKLNLGCGEDKKDGYVNLDWNTLAHPDVQHNLNVLPYPFPDNTFDVIEAFHILEHLDKPFDVMKELHRITRPGGVVHIKVPHFSRGFTHAEHAHGFNVTFPYYFDKGFSCSGFFGVEFELLHMELHWFALAHYARAAGHSGAAIKVLELLSIPLSWLANIAPNFCSRIWCFWVGGFEEIEFKFKCIK